MAHYQKIEDIEAQEASMPNVPVEDTTIQWLITKEKDDAPNFAMRRFVIKSGGTIGLHDHWYEHEILILGGEGVMYGDDAVEHSVSRDSFVFVPGDEPHGYRNDGDEDFVFLCMIPNMDKKG
jgi:quercetin dioxygenase-like cupin family protein